MFELLLTFVVCTKFFQGFGRCRNLRFTRHFLEDNPKDSGKWEGWKRPRQYVGPKLQ